MSFISHVYYKLLTVTEFERTKRFRIRCFEVGNIKKREIYIVATGKELLTLFS